MLEELETIEDEETGRSCTFYKPQVLSRPLSLTSGEQCHRAHSEAVGYRQITVQPMPTFKLFKHEQIAVGLLNPV